MSPTLFALETLHCTHQELCKMVNQIALENKITDLKTATLVTVSGDPHEFEPSSQEIKNLISANFLLTGPNELNPWIKKINFQRSKLSNLKTISLTFDKTDFSFYPMASGEVLSHFWLYPKIYCSLKSKLETQLVSNGFKIKKMANCDPYTAEKNLQNVLYLVKTPIILTHDALLPLMQSLLSTQKNPISIIAIKGSGHHEETPPLSIKKMYDALNNPKVIWVIEEGINVPQNILNKIRPNDQVIRIDTAQTKEADPFSVMSELASKLK